jgi:hypothetical protein
LGNLEGANLFHWVRLEVKGGRQLLCWVP